MHSKSQFAGAPASIRASAFTTTAMAAALATTAIMSAPAAAQDGAGTLEAADQIIVTARRGAELLTDIPLTIDVFGAEDVNKLSIDTVEDIVRFAPGLSLTQGSRPDSTRLSIRGLQGDVGRSSVALRINDIDVTAEAINASGLGYFPNLRLLDLERIELVKGAQVALYGRSAFGGALNFVTRRPDLEEWNGSINGQATTEREYEGTVRVNGPIVDGKVGLGLVASYWTDGGSYRNQLSQEYVGGTEGSGFAASLNLEPFENFKGFVRAEFSNDKPETRAGVHTAPNGEVVFPADVAAVIGAASSPVLLGEVPNVGSDQVFTALDPITGRVHPGLDRDTFSVTADFEYAFDGVAVRSLTGLFDIDTITYKSTPFQPHPWVNADGSINAEGTGEISPGFVPQSFYLDTSTEIFSQEFQIFSNDESARFRWLIGGLYWEEKILQGQDQPTVIPLGNISTADVRNFMRNEIGDLTRTFKRDVEHMSGFIWAEFDVTDKLSVSLEGRYANEDITYITDSTVNVSLGFPADPMTNTPVTFQQVSVIPDPQEPGLIDENYFVPKAVITYRPNEDLTFYVSAAKSVKPSGHSTGGADTFNQFTRFDEEILWSYEGGVKASLFDNKVNFNGAFYYLDYTDQQVDSTVFDEDSELPRTSTENAGKARLFGTDIELTVRPVEKLTVRANYTYTNSEYEEYEFFTSTSGTAARGPCVRFETLPNGQDGCVISYEGNRSGQTPLHKFQIFANYTTPINGAFDFFIEPNIRFTDERFLNASNLASAPSYWRVDLRGGIQSESWSVIAFVNNLADDDTPEDIIQFLDYAENFAPAGVSFLPDPITFGVNTTFNF